MLVAQIQNQDPEAPVDPSQIIAQNAQFTASLATVRLANQMAHYEQIATTFRSMGKPAEYIDPNDFTGTPQVGIIQGADYSSVPPSLIIDGVSVPLDNVTRIDAEGSGTATITENIKQNQLMMLGKQVEYFDPGDGSNQTGVVDDIDLISGQGLMTINGTSVPITNIIRVIN